MELKEENLQKLDNDGVKIYLRCSIIPGVNADEEHIKGIAKIAAKLKKLQKIDLMTYHQLGESKLKRFGLKSTFNSKEFADREECGKLRSLLEALCSVPV